MAANKQKVIQVLRGFLLVEALAFFMIAIVHLTKAQPDFWAAGAELIVVGALIIGLVSSRAQPAAALRSVIKAQLFALLITVLGMFIVIMTFTAKTLPDLMFHSSSAVVLITGLTIAYRSKRAQ